MRRQAIAFASPYSSTLAVNICMWLYKSVWRGPAADVGRLLSRISPRKLERAKNEEYPLWGAQDSKISRRQAMTGKPWSCIGCRIQALPGHGDGQIMCEQDPLVSLLTSTLTHHPSITLHYLSPHLSQLLLPFQTNCSSLFGSMLPRFVSHLLLWKLG